MSMHATLQTTDQPLTVIGFNARFNDLDDIDQVEACLYRGEPLLNSTLFDVREAVQPCIDLVLSANKLSLNKIALIVVGDVQGDAVAEIDRYGSYQRVDQLSEALLCSAQLSKQSLAVLIIAASMPDVVINREQASISFDRDFSGYAQLQGVACLLLCSASFAEQHHSIVYGHIDDVATAVHGGELGPIQETIAHCIASRALSAEHKITTLEVSSCADAQLNQLEQQALLQSYQQHYAVLGGEQTLASAISCQRSVLGENGQLSQLMSVIHGVIALQQRYRPAIFHWQGPQAAMLAQWQASPFYLFNRAAPVFPLPSGALRSNAVSIMTAHNYTHLRLSEPSNSALHQNGYMNQCKATLFIVGGDTQAQLLAKLQQLSATTRDLKAVAQQLYHEHQQQCFVYKVVLIAASVEQLQQEIHLSLSGVAKAFSGQRDWKTPNGSYFTSQPSANAQSAFLYPGIGASYIGMGRELFHLFPEIYPSVIAITHDIGASLQDKHLNPRSLQTLDVKQIKALDLALRHNLASIAECGVGYACVFTQIFQQVFELQADHACGYSMGEVSMFAALGCWQNPAAMSARLANSATFNQQLSGELRTLRTLWQLPAAQQGAHTPIWESYNIKGTQAQVQAAINEGERVYITLINTPDSLVIAGYPDDCLAVVRRLGVRAMALNIANAIHSAPAYQEYEQMLALYEMPVTARIQTKMLSSSCYLPIPQHAKAMAVSIAKCLCEPVDFPRLVNRLASKQVDVFIEMGAGRSLCSWVDKILASHAEVAPPHISVPINAKGSDEQLTYARAVAKLVSFGVAINIERFFSGSILQVVEH